jgi:hypothetical protein
MMKYNCKACGAKLETEDELSGKQESCPVCGKPNVVPLSRRDVLDQERREKEKARIEAERLRREEDEKLRQEVDILLKERLANQQKEEEKRRLEAQTIANEQQVLDPSGRENPRQDAAAVGQTLRAAERKAETKAAGFFEGAEKMLGKAVYGSNPRAEKPGLPENQTRNYGAVMIIGYVYVILGAIASLVDFIVTFYWLAQAGTHDPRNPWGDVPARDWGLGVAIGVSVILVGIFQVAFGQLLFCVRDMARNSFHLLHIKPT